MKPSSLWLKFYRALMGQLYVLHLVTVFFIIATLTL
jgi:hypothetical protein